MTRSRDIADQQKNLGGAVAPFVAGKNFAINGGFDIFQRGSYSTSTPGYSLDRWYAFNSGATTTVTQQTTGVPVGSQYCARIAYGGTAVCNFWQYLETANVKALQGKTVTLSAKFRRNASFNANYILALYKSSTVNAGPAASWASVGSVTATNAAMPTGTTSSDWLTVSTTLTIPADGTAEGLSIVCFENANQTTGAYVEIAQVQLEIGNVQTPFARAGGSIGGELALCQRYYQTLQGSQYYDIGLAAAIETTQTATYLNIPTMRVSPTCSFSGTLYVYMNGVITYPSAYSVGPTSQNGVYLFTTVSGLTRGQTGRITGHTTPFNLQMSSEL
jgi:hypothetical protein